MYIVPAVSPRPCRGHRQVLERRLRRPSATRRKASLQGTDVAPCDAALRERAQRARLARSAQTFGEVDRELRPGRAARGVESRLEEEAAMEARPIDPFAGRPVKTLELLGDERADGGLIFRAGACHVRVPRKGNRESAQRAGRVRVDVIQTFSDASRDSGRSPIPARPSAPTPVATCAYVARGARPYRWTPALRHSLPVPFRRGGPTMVPSPHPSPDAPARRIRGPPDEPPRHRAAP